MPPRILLDYSNPKDFRLSYGLIDFKIHRHSSGYEYIVIFQPQYPKPHQYFKINISALFKVDNHLRVFKISPHGPLIDPHTALLKEKGVFLDARFTKTVADNPDYLDPLATRILCPENRPPRLKPLNLNPNLPFTDHAIDNGIELYKRLYSPDPLDPRLMTKEQMDVKIQEVIEKETKEAKEKQKLKIVSKEKEKEERKRLKEEQANEVALTKRKEADETIKSKAERKEEKKRLKEEKAKELALTKQKEKELKKKQREEAAIEKLLKSHYASLKPR